MTNFVKENEKPALIIESGDNTYLCYPDFGVPAGASGYEIPKWAVKCINQSGSTTTILWAGGNTNKVNAIDDLSALTFQYLV